MTTVRLAPSIPAGVLSPQQLELQAKFKQFTEQEIKPIVAEHDAQEDPIMCFPWEVWRKAARLGYRLLAMPPEYGGIGLDILTHCLLIEEVAVADVGFSIAFHQVWKLQPQLLKTAYLRQEVLPKFLADDDYQFCFSVTEPGAGTDNFLPYEGADGGARTRADRQPNGDWLINGKKHFQSVTGIAKGSFVLCRTDFTRPVSKGATFLFVDHSTPGFHFGHMFNKLGWRLQPNGESIFENVRVPDGARIGEVNQGLAAVGAIGKPHAPTKGAWLTGGARGIYETTFEWAHRQSRGGKPIADQQVVQMQLADMWTDLEVCRTVTWRAAWNVDNVPNYDVKLALACEQLAADVCLRVCTTAMQLWRKHGYHTENPIEKLWRDGVQVLHGGGTNDTRRIKIFQALAGKAVGGLHG